MKTGKIVKWNEEKGFGFIRSESGNGDLFFHVSSLNSRKNRPETGLEVIFESGKDNQGRNCAVNVRFAGEKEEDGPAAKALYISSLFLLSIALLVWFDYIPIAVSFLYLGMSILTFIIYAIDKSAAMAGNRRTPEINLHFMALLGGWPGALFAQQLLRHKSKKEFFRAVFWVTVILNICVLVLLVSPFGAEFVLIIKQLLLHLAA